MTVPVGICSTAHVHADAYLEVLEDLGAAEVVGLAADDHRAEELGRAHEVPVRPQEAILEDAEAVVVASTNADRSRWIEPAAAAGVAVLAEKPLATTTARAEQLVATCAEAGVTLAVAMPLRHCRPAERARKLLLDGAIGDLEAVSGTNRGLLPGGWFQDPDAAGGGAVMDHTVHIVDLVCWWTGERVEEVYAETATYFHDGPLEDVNYLSMTLSDGTIVSLDGSWSRPEGWRFWGDATVELVGTDGTMDVDCFGDVLTLTRSGAGGESVHYGRDPNRRLLEQFLATVAGGGGHIATGREAVDAVAVVEAAYESADRGEPVTV